MTYCIKGTSDQEEKAKHSSGKLGKGHEQDIYRSKTAEQLCVPTKCPADSKIPPAADAVKSTLHALSHLILTAALVILILRHR